MKEVLCVIVRLVVAFLVAVVVGFVAAAAFLAEPSHGASGTDSDALQKPVCEGRSHAVPVRAVRSVPFES